MANFEKRCRKNCFKCDKLNIKTDANGYPYEYECLRYDTTLDMQEVLLDKSEFLNDRF